MPDIKHGNFGGKRRVVLHVAGNKKLRAGRARFSKQGRTGAGAISQTSDRPRRGSAESGCGQVQVTGQLFHNLIKAKGARQISGQAESERKRIAGRLYGCRFQNPRGCAIQARAQASPQDRAR